MIKLFLQALQTFVIGFLVLGLFLFLTAWTLNYWQAWLFIVIFMGSANAIGIYLALYDPVLLERRKKGGPAAEERMTQKIVISLAIVGFCALLVFSAFDYRFGWSSVSPIISFLGAVLVALGFLIDFFVFRENSYGAATIQIAEGQKVISTGLYALVRHPMYMGVAVMAIGTPIALGSWWGLAVLLVMLPVLMLRILDEEMLLKDDLPGYIEYTQKVRYRLVPNLW